MRTLGSHFKFQIAEEYRNQATAFYLDVLQWSAIPSPAPNVLLFQTPCREMVGVFLVPAAEALTDAQHRAGVWLEIMTDDVDSLVSRLRAVGVHEIEYFDKAHVYFQSPGGPVFRVAPESEREPRS